VVHGLEKFKEYFKDCTNQYVLIGGTACDILMNELGAPFRATKDLDMVLIVEAIDASFGETFWKFIEDGGYKNREKSDGKNQFYRFTNPKNKSYPNMIELFSKQSNNFIIKSEEGITPIHIDDSIISLSAILINDEYYELLIKGKRTVDGYSIIELETVILFKIKAWLDMKQRKENGENVDYDNIKKHKNDIFRLLVNVEPSNRVEISKEIKNDINRFIELINNDRPDLVNLGIRKANLNDLEDMIMNIFILKSI